MYLISIILFFCGTLYFMQCQGEGPTREQRTLVKDIVVASVGQVGIDLDQLKSLYEQVSLSLGMPKVLPGIDELKIDLKYSMDTAEVLTLAFVATADLQMAKSVRDIVWANVGQDGIGLDQLKAVYAKVAKLAGLSNEFPRMNLLQRKSTDRNFTKKEVFTLALAFITSEYLSLSKFIQNMVWMHAKPNGMGYEDLLEVIDGVRRETGIVKRFYSFSEFKANILNGKLTVNQVEKIIIDNLFN